MQISRIALAAAVSTLGGAAFAGGTLTEEACAGLVGWTIAESEITLPSTGGAVTAATWETGPGADLAYCQVTGTISPVDPEAPDITWQANLPEHWNGKLLQYGGGGYNGIIPDLLDPTTLGLSNAPIPLARGYAVFGSDSGHTAANSNDASFAASAEALENYAYMHIRKTLDAVRPLAEQAYGSAVERVYFEGGSTGGREGLTAALRWPDAYDGILSNYATARFMGLRLWGSALARAIYDDNSAGWIEPELVERIAGRAIETCDTLDGAADGLVSNPAACRAQSDALVEELACTDPTATEGCLTPTQVERTIAVYHDGYELPYELAHGFRQYDGYNSLEGVVMALGDQPQYSEPVESGPHAHHAARAYEFFTHFVNTDGNLDFSTFNIEAPGLYRERLIELSEMIDANNPDLSAFAKSGGKLILTHGVEDASVSPLGNAEVYEAIVESTGPEVAEDFVRFFMIPGLAHGNGNFSPEWDNLAALDRWVEEGVPPVAQVVTDGTDSPTRGRTRPLCHWPTWPQYDGTGDINQASSYACVAG